MGVLEINNSGFACRTCGSPVVRSTTLCSTHQASVQKFVHGRNFDHSSIAFAVQRALEIQIIFRLFGFFLIK